jgi:type VI secretion system protein VasG
VFYQVFDKGNMKDGEGRDVDFKNTIILMTTNAGTDVIKSLCSDPDTTPEPDDFVSAIFPELLKTFKPAFLGRLSIIPYYPLRPEVIRSIAKLKLKKIAGRLREHHGATFSYDDAVLDSITQRCSEVDTGARNIDHILTKTLLPSLSIELLARAAQGDSIDSVHVGLTGQHEFTYQF